MDNPRAEKVAVVEEVRQRFRDADAAILTEYRGLKVKDLAGLRRTLRASGGDYKIYKNTLVRLAARQSSLSELEGMLLGPTAIAFVDGDAAAVAKALRDYARTNPLLVIKGGVLGDRVIGVSETAALAELPSREVLLGRFAGALAAPLQQLAGLLQALPRNLAYGLAALRDKRAADAPADAPDAGEAAPSAPADGAGGPDGAGAPDGDVTPVDTAPAEAGPAEAAPASAESLAAGDADASSQPTGEASAEAPAETSQIEAGAAPEAAGEAAAEAPAEPTPSAEQPQE